MAESDPYATSYAEKERKEPRLATSKRHTQAAADRRISMNRGNRARQEIEGKAPNWRNEPSVLTPTPPPGGQAFHPGSFEGGLHYNFKRRR